MRLAGVWRELYTSNSVVRARFTWRFHRAVGRLSREFLAAYRQYQRHFRGPHSEREAAVRAYLLNAFNDVILSSNLLLQCSMVPSGNLMRQFIESISAALLFSSKAAGYFERFSEAPNDFQVNCLPLKLAEPETLSLLGLDPKWVENLKRIREFYHLYSHASAFSTSFMARLQPPYRIFIGSFFDNSKIKPYRIELIRRITACRLLGNVVPACKDLLEESGPGIDQGVTAHNST
jgi:hypothetical protein